MPQFRRKPIEVEAVQFYRRDARERTKGAGMDLVTGVSIVNGISTVLTRDGVMPVSDGDWIVTYADGAQEVWRPSAFAAMWEQVQ